MKATGRSSVIERTESYDKLCAGGVHMLVFPNGRVKHAGKCDCAKRRPAGRWPGIGVRK